MDTLSYKTVSVSKATASHDWVVVDAEGQVLGRMASKVAKILRGKNKPTFTPHAECGDYVIVINAEKVALTGNKMSDKVYIRHSGYPGGQRFATPRELMNKKPEKVIELGVKGMLPKTKLGAEMFRHLFVYAGTEHPHEAQKPKTININTIR